MKTLGEYVEWKPPVEQGGGGGAGGDGDLINTNF